MSMSTVTAYSYLEYSGVEDYHDQAGDVEGAEGGVDDEVRVVEGADDGFLLHLPMDLTGIGDESLVELEILN